MRLATLTPFLFALLALAVAVYFLLLDGGKGANIIPTYGVVTSKNVDEGQVRSEIQFVTESGQTVHFQSHSELSPYYKKDDTVYLHYNLAHPEQAQDVVSPVKNQNMVYTILALLASALSLIVFIKVGQNSSAILMTSARLLLAGLGFVFVCTAGLSIYMSQKNEAAWVQATGQVVDVLTVQSNPNQPGNYDHQQLLYYPIIQYTTKLEQNFTMKGDVGYHTPIYKAGETVNIRYDENLPHLATLEGSPASLILKLVLLLIGVVCLVLSIKLLK